MTMEIERKARVRDIPGLRGLLRERFGPPGFSEKRDAYFIEPGIAITESAATTARVVRIRRLADSALVTAKIRTLRGATEVNREHEFLIPDPAAFEEFLCGYLGFCPLVEKIKRTEAYSDPPLTLELSEVVSLGWFFEVEYLGTDAGETESASARIDGVFEEFGAFLDALEPSPYMVLLLRRAGRFRG